MVARLVRVTTLALALEESQSDVHDGHGGESVRRAGRGKQHVAEQTRLQGLHLTSLLRKGLGLHGRTKVLCGVDCGSAIINRSK